MERTIPEETLTVDAVTPADIRREITPPEPHDDHRDERSGDPVQDPSDPANTPEFVEDLSEETFEDICVSINAGTDIAADRPDDWIVNGRKAEYRAGDMDEWIGPVVDIIVEAPEVEWGREESEFLAEKLVAAALTATGGVKKNASATLATTYLGPTRSDSG